MKHTYLILAFILFLSQQSVGQRRSEKATVTFSSGTETAGFIAIRAAYTYSNGILFSTTESGEFVEHPATSITGFSIGEMQYERFEIDSEMRLLLYLAKGKVDLLQLEEQGLTRFYIKSPGKSITNLYYKETITSGGFLHKAEAYKETLMAAMSDCPSIQSKIKNTTLFNAGNLLRIFKRYYACVGDTMAEVDKKGKSLDIFAGGFGGVALRDPQFRLVGVTLDFVPLRKKISFISVFYQYGVYDNKLTFNGSPYMQRRRMKNFGARFSVVVISLRVAEPYLTGNVGVIDYKFENIINRNVVPAELVDPELRHVNIGFGAGLKFTPFNPCVVRIELNSNVIPQSGALGTYAQPLAALTACVAFKIN